MKRFSEAPLVPLPVDYPVVPVTGGGTAGTTGSQAVQDLGGVEKSSYNQPNGPVQLDAQGRLPASSRPTDLAPKVTLSGNTTPYAGNTVQFVITNYSSFLTYDIQVSAGTVSRVNETITVVCPNNAGQMSLTVNGRAFSINVLAITPAAPTITSPTNNSTNVGSKPILTGSAFAMLGGGSDTHLNTDWQVASDAGFSSIVAQSLADATNKTSYQLQTALNPNTTYYARMRYRGTTTGVGSYSAVVSFTTKLIFVPDQELTNVVVNTGGLPSRRGIAISGDGLRVVVADGTAADEGSVKIYSKASGSWVLEQTIGPLNGRPGFVNEIPSGVCISDDGTRLAYGESGYWDGSNWRGAFSVYLRTGTTWALEQRIIGTNSGANYFGKTIRMNLAGNLIAVASNAGDFGAGGIHVYARTGTTWNNEINMLGGSANQYFGYCWDMSADGNRIVTGYNSNGFLQVFDRTNGWNAVGSALAAGYTFNTPVAISGDGNTVAIGYPTDYGTNNLVDGLVRVWKYNGSAWAQQGNGFIPTEAVGKTAGFGVGLAIAPDGSWVFALPSAAINGMFNAYYSRYVSTTWSQFNKIATDVSTGNINPMLSFKFRTDAMMLAAQGSASSPNQRALFRTYI